MKSGKHFLFLVIIIFSACTATHNVRTYRQPVNRNLALMTKVADRQIDSLKPTIDVWTETLFYTGLTELYKLTNDARYYTTVFNWSKGMEWQPGNDINHADDQSAGQVYLDLYSVSGEEYMYTGIKSVFDGIMDAGHNGKDIWYWCDALYMAPPVLAGLSEVSGNSEYIDYMNRLWWETTDHLYSEEDSLFYRDARFVPELNDTLDKKIFWSRGNGWVLAGIARVLRHMPENYPDREKYINLYREMAEKIITLQQEDGLWRTDLLRPERYPNPESSGTSLFTYALAWGINHGILDKEKYTPVVARAWKGLARLVTPDGKVGYTQDVDYRPGPVDPGTSTLFGTGAFLLAGSEINKIENIILKSGTYYPVFTDNGAWTWFSGPRAYHYEGRFNKTYSGWVDNNGDIVIGSYDQEREIVTTSVVKEKLNIDDHANPAVIVRPDGTVLTFYAAHNGKKAFMRASEAPENIRYWGKEQVLAESEGGGYGFTYPNVMQVKEDNNRLYLFFRGADWQPVFSTSEDGVIWSGFRKFLENKNARPYAIYTERDGVIHVAYTTAHPYEVEYNNIYYVYIKDKHVYRADGTEICGIGKTPFQHDEGTLVYDSEKSVVKGWLWDIAADEDGRPVIAYTTYPEPDAHDYHYTVYRDNEWYSNKVTDGGGWFPEADSTSEIFEPYYSGGMALDKRNPSILYVSRPVDSVFEIEKWTTSNDGKEWEHLSITSGSAYNNVRPVTPANASGNGLNVLWMYGEYNHYQDYNTAIKIKK